VFVWTSRHSGLNPADPGDLHDSVHEPIEDGPLTVIQVYSSIDAFTEHNTWMHPNIPRLAALLTTPPQRPVLYEPVSLGGNPKESLLRINSVPSRAPARRRAQTPAKIDIASVSAVALGVPALDERHASESSVGARCIPRRMLAARSRSLRVLGLRPMQQSRGVDRDACSRTRGAQDRFEPG
jgi:hypothetical protein